MAKGARNTTESAPPAPAPAAHDTATRAAPPLSRLLMRAAPLHAHHTSHHTAATPLQAPAPRKAHTQMVGRCTCHAPPLSTAAGRRPAGGAGARRRGCSSGSPPTHSLRAPSPARLLARQGEGISLAPARPRQCPDEARATGRLRPAAAPSPRLPRARGAQGGSMA
jgi:hypothetical protein